MAIESNKFLLCGGGNGVPIGAFTWWFGLETQIPEGWLKLDGSEFSVTDYPKLYSILGTNVLPDMVGKFIKGGDVGQIEEEAGLPNIEGVYADYVSNVQAISLSGAFYKADYGQQDEHCVHTAGYISEGDVQQLALFDASKGTVNTNGEYMAQEDSPYGKSDTVTPNNISAIPIIKAGTKGTSLIYTNEQIDTFFNILESRVVALETGTTLADNNEAAHNVSPDAHETLFSEKASTTSATDLSTDVDTLESDVASLVSLIEQKESEMEG